MTSAKNLETIQRCAPFGISEALQATPTLALNSMLDVSRSYENLFSDHRDECSTFFKWKKTPKKKNQIYEPP